MKAKSSSQIDPFFYPMFANRARVNEPTLVVNMSEFFHQIVANLPYNATEIIKSLKTIKI